MTKPSTKVARRIARRQRLFEILSWGRPHGSEVEQRFCREFLDKVPGMRQDGFGNRIIQIGKPNGILWSCHVDTVAKTGSLNELDYDPEQGILKLANQKAGLSLGADDGAGVWLMLEMIRGGKPGLYVFHRGEEQGCLGSKWIAENTPELLDGIQQAIAFDRGGTQDVITHQAYGRGCSDTYAEQLAALLNETDGLRFKPDPTGIYTDTNEYLHLVAECTNLSVGYESNHGPRETLDVWHLEDLYAAVMKSDFTTLPVCREPGEDDYGYGYGSRWGASSRSSGSGRVSNKDVSYKMSVMDNPMVAVRLLKEAGISLEDFEYICWADDKYDQVPWDEAELAEYDEIDWENAQ